MLSQGCGYGGCGYGGCNRDLTRGAVDQAAEFSNFGVTHGTHESRDEAVVQAAHEFGVLRSKLSERALGKRHHGCIWVVECLGNHRIEAEHIEIGHERLQAGWGRGVRASATRALITARGKSVVRAAAQPFGHRQDHARKQRHNGRLEAQRWCVGRQRIPVLGSADLTAPIHGNGDEADVTHAFEMRPNRVRVQLDHVCNLGGGERLGRPREFQVDRVTSVVAERLEQVEAGTVLYCTVLCGHVLCGHVLFTNGIVTHGVEITL